MTQKQDPTASGETSVLLFRSGVFEPSDGSTPTQLIASVCSGCGRHYFPVRSMCPHCGDEATMSERRVSGGGRIYASTVVRVPSPVGIKSPYAYGYVDMDEAKLRVLALFTSIDPSDIAPGRRVEMVTDVLREDAEGKALVAYKFRPMEGGAQ